MMPTAETDKNRRAAIRESERWNGVDFVEVSDDQRTLTVYFLGKAPEKLDPANVRISGGRRITDIKAIDVVIYRQADRERDDYMEIQLDKSGDWSTYQLCLVELDETGTEHPFTGFDPRYACVAFSFKANCPSDLDCAAAVPCPPEPLVEPSLNYLAKDYASFRQLLFDRLALIMPDWQERHVPDLGVTLVELLAYVGDQLSYYQDAVATEAYLNTARQRISVRRHARLVDYTLHEGCNARAWLCLSTSQEEPDVPKDLSFITSYDDSGSLGPVLSPDDLRNVALSRFVVFEPVLRDKPLHLYAAHNEIPFHTWGGAVTCLPRGSTSATLQDAWAAEEATAKPGTPTAEQTAPPLSESCAAKQPPIVTEASEPPRRLKNLRAGDILIFEEVRDPKTGKAADASPAHRHAVRLTRAIPGVDNLLDQPIVEITWAREDALPFALCLSAVSAAPDCRPIGNISVARGNVILADHGRTIGRIRLDEQAPEELGPVPIKAKHATCSECGCPPAVEIEADRFRPALQHTPLTFRQAHDDSQPASKQIGQDVRQAVPALHLRRSGPDPHQEWNVKADLLNSTATDLHYVVEVDNDQRSWLRFGDGLLGRRPDGGSMFNAGYRIGNGTAGNVGAETIRHIVLQTPQSGFELRVRNPLPASGGTDPESIQAARLAAPTAFRADIQRAITADDYARLAERDPRLQRAAAQLRWIGSWYEINVLIDPKADVVADKALIDEVRQALRPYRRIGHDLVVNFARHVPLVVTLKVCVQPRYLRAQVKTALLAAFSNRRLPDGSNGFFHPDKLSFGQGIALSQLVALAHTVAGVASVEVAELHRYGQVAAGEIESGFLPIGAQEIARLDNDPAAPEYGRLTLNMVGGR